MSLSGWSKLKVSGGLKPSTTQTISDSSSRKAREEAEEEEEEEEDEEEEHEITNEEPDSVKVNMKRDRMCFITP